MFLGFHCGSISVIFCDNVVFLEAPGTGFPSWLPFWVVLGAFGAFFCGLWHVNGVQGVPKWSQNGDKIGQKVHAEKDVIWDRLFECFWWALGVLLGPWALQNECFAEARRSFSKIHSFRA